MKKSLLYILILFFFTNCGFQPIYSKKNLAVYDFSLNDLIFKGDRKINIKLKQKLFNYKNEKKSKIFDLTIISDSTKTVSARDAKGDPSIFQLEIKILINITDQKGEKFDPLNFNEKFKYKNNTDKILLKDYEDQIRKSLAETVAGELILNLAKIQ